MTLKRYFTGEKNAASLLIRGFLVLLFIFAVVFFLWCLMKTNKILEDKREDAAYIEQLKDQNEELRALLEAPLDDTYKIRIAREKLGMCFPDEVIFHTEME